MQGVHQKTTASPSLQNSLSWITRPQWKYKHLHRRSGAAWLEFKGGIWRDVIRRRINWPSSTSSTSSPWSVLRTAWHIRGRVCRVRSRQWHSQCAINRHSGRWYYNSRGFGSRWSPKYRHLPSTTTSTKCDQEVNLLCKFVGKVSPNFIKEEPRTSSSWHWTWTWLSVGTKNAVLQALDEPEN